jgi:galactokinase
MTRQLLAMANETTNRSDPTLASALSQFPSAGSALFVAVTGELHDRLSQFAEENFELVPAIADAFRQADVDRLGTLVDRSQRLAETLLKNQTPETTALQRQARELGAAAASAFGAGFGGSVWALVRTHDARSFVDTWADRYRALYRDAGMDAVFFVTSPGPPASVVAA